MHKMNELYDPILDPEGKPRTKLRFVETLWMPAIIAGVAGALMHIVVRDFIVMLGFTLLTPFITFPFSVLIGWIIGRVWVSFYGASRLAVIQAKALKDKP